MKALPFIVFLIKSIPITTIPLNVNLVKDYLKFTSIRIGLFLNCNNASEAAENMMQLQNDDIWMNFRDISNEDEIHTLNYKHIFERLSSPLSFVISLECDKSITVLEEISSRKMFHYERFWLIFSKNLNQAYQILSHQFINMDAEIYLALPINET